MNVLVFAHTERRKGTRQSLLVSIVAVTGGIITGNLASEGLWTAAITAGVITLATIAVLLALSDYKDWDERKEQNLSKAAKYTIIATASTLITAGASIAIPDRTLGGAMLAVGFAILLIWGAIYHYLEWRDTH